MIRSDFQINDKVRDDLHREVGIITSIFRAVRTNLETFVAFRLNKDSFAYCKSIKNLKRV